MVHQNEAEKKFYVSLIEGYENRCRKETDVSQFYDELTALGLEYGSTFANLRYLRSAPGECIGKIEIPETAAVMPMQYQFPAVIHPATLDSFLHTIFVALAAQVGSLQDPAVPVSADEIFIAQDITKKPGSVLNTYMSTSQKDYRYMSAFITVFDETHEPGHMPVVEIRDLTCATLERDRGSEAEGEIPSRAYNVKWAPAVDLLSIDQLTKTCTAPSPPNATFIRSKLERAAFYFLHAAINTVLETPTPTVNHQQTLRDFLTSQVELAITKHSDHGWSSANESEKASLIEEVRASSGVGRTLCYAGEQLAKVVAGDVVWSDLISRLDFNAFIEDPHLFQNTKSAATFLDLLGHKNPSVSILTIGPQSGLASLGLLSLLSELKGVTPGFAAFHHTDAELNITDTIKEKFPLWADFIEFKDVGSGRNQIDEIEPYDIVVAFHVLDSSNSLPNILSRARKLLKPGGKLLLVGRALKSLVATVLWGFLPSVISDQENNKELSKSQIENIIQESDFSISAALSSSTNKTNYGALFLSLPDESSKRIKNQKALIITEEDNSSSRMELQSRLSKSGIETEVVSLQDAHPTSQHACIVLSELDKKVLMDPSYTEWEAIKRLSLQSAGLLWVTRAGSRSSIDPDLSLVAGLMRTIRSETGDKPIITLDLDSASTLGGNAATEHIL